MKVTKFQGDQTDVMVKTEILLVHSPPYVHVASPNDIRCLIRVHTCEHQRFIFCWYIGWVNPRNNYFSYIKKHVLDQIMLTMFHLVLKTESLASTLLLWTTWQPHFVCVMLYLAQHTDEKWSFCFIYFALLGNVRLSNPQYPNPKNK